MTDRLRWAILGTGKIANRFAAALNNIPEQAELLAVGSRSAETGRAFAEKYGIPKAHIGYENVFADPEVDIVYVGTPGVFHHRDVTMALEAGKHVLCEKVLTMNAREARDVIGLARRRKLFLMEAMWTRFFPIHVRIRELLAGGAIGEILGITCAFCSRVPYDPNNRWFRLDLGAGVLIDTGSYGISWAYSLLGPPAEVVGLAVIGPGGGDDQSAYILKYSGGQLVTIMASQISYDVKDAVVFGSRGKIEVHEPWYKPTAMTLHIEDRPPERIEMPLGKYNGYEYEALAVMDCIRKGKTECEVMPLDETLAIIQTLDALRAQWGVKYPGEE